MYVFGGDVVLDPPHVRPGGRQKGGARTVAVDKEGIVRSIVHGTNVAKRAALRQKIEEYRQK